MPAHKLNKYAAKPAVKKKTARLGIALTEAQLEAYKIAACEQEARNFSAWIRDALDGQASYGGRKKHDNHK